MNLYALRHKPTGTLLGFRVTSNDGTEFCGSTSVELDLYSDDVWVTDDLATATRVANESTSWYNASMSFPENQYIGKLEIVTFTLVA